MNFGGLDSFYTSFEKATFVVIPVPYDLTSTYQSGSRRGPGAVLEASCNMELYDDELSKETYLAGIHTTEAIHADARGPEFMVEPIRQQVAEVVNADKIPVVIGGEHSISFGVAKAMKAKYPNLSVLHFDAHADMRDSYQGSPFSHACVARRIWEIAPIVQVGIRSMSVEEAAFIKEKAVKTFSADYVLEESRWWEKIVEHLSDDVFITIDIDCLDPGCMPATGTPEPGGISWKDLLRLVKEVAKRSRIRGFDCVELSPIPGMVAPDFLVSKLIYRIMGYVSQI